VKVIFTPTEGPKLQSAARIKKLTANVLEQVSGGGKAGKLLSFSRVSGHPCDLASAQDIDPSQRGSAIGFLKGLKYVFLFYLVFVFGAFVVVVRNLFNARFILPFVGKWIGVTIGGCLVLYGSAYGFYLSENYDKWLVNGLVNKGFTYFMPYMVSYGEGVVEKDSLKFWLVTLFVTSFYLSFPTIAWELWQKKLYQGTFFHRVIKWAKSAYKWGMITVLTLVAFTSIVSPSGPYSWIALIIGYIGIIKALRYTPERLSRHIGKQVEKWEDAEAIKQ
jgi:hypothetical protein